MARTMVPTEPEAGLLAAGRAIPLRGVRVEATLQEFCSRVTVTQRYANEEAHPIEAVYVFPLEESAAVCGFAALVDGVEVVGEVKEREEAFDRYDDALAAGHGAYLLDQERPDIFVASIGNLPPGKEVLVKLSYVSELTREGDDVRFVLPTTVSPRYAPAEDQRGVGQPPAERLNPPLAWDVPYGLELEVAVEMASNIRSVESPSHPISIEVDGASAMVRLGANEAAMDQDFVLKIRPAEPEAPRACLEKTPDGESVAMVVFQPKLDPSEAACEAIFLLDRSGSMEGTSIRGARNALQLCLRSLSEGCWFNIVGFGSRFERLYPESVPYDEKHLAEANRCIPNMRADLGGTEILPALDAVLSAPTRPGLPRQVFLLTDGQVTNTEAVIALVRKHADTTRVFTFGIGAGASHHLVRGVARAGEGASEHISPGERVERKVLRQLKRALTPALTDVRIDWSGLHVKQAPFRVPPVFADGRVLVYGFLEEPPHPATEIRLHARSHEQELSFSLPLGTERVREGRLVATLAARALLRDLEEGGSAFHERGSLQERYGRDRVKEEAVRLGVKYGLASRWTSFVAVERREIPVEAPMHLRRIPAAMTRGWGGTDVIGSPLRAAARTGFGKWLQPTASAPVDYDTGSIMMLDFGPTPNLSPEDSQLEQLVRLQRADGSWELSEDFAKAIGSKLRKVDRSLPDFTGDREEARRAWATALVIEWLAIHASEWSSELSLLEVKARAWLTQCQAKPASGEEWLLLAARFLQS